VNKVTGLNETAGDFSRNTKPQSTFHPWTNFTGQSKDWRIPLISQLNDTNWTNRLLTERWGLGAASEKGGKEYQGQSRKTEPNATIHKLSISASLNHT
jgi:hypothetical protein